MICYWDYSDILNKHYHMKTLHFKGVFSKFKRVVSSCSICLLSGRKYIIEANLLFLSLGEYSAVLCFATL